VTRTDPQPDQDGREGSNLEGFVFALGAAEIRTAAGWTPVAVAVLGDGTGLADGADVCLEFLPDRSAVGAVAFEDLGGPGVWLTLSKADAHRLKRALDRLL
jgi:hypothetical protein